MFPRSGSAKSFRRHRCSRLLAFSYYGTIPDITVYTVRRSGNSDFFSQSCTMVNPGRWPTHGGSSSLELYDTFFTYCSSTILRRRGTATPRTDHTSNEYTQHKQKRIRNPEIAKTTMHISQTALLTSNSTTSTVPSSGRGVTEETSHVRYQKMAIAAASREKALPNSSLRLRSNLLHRLGIHGGKEQLQPRQPSRGLLDGLPVTEQPLTGEEDENHDERQEPQQGMSWTERLMVFVPSSLESRADAASSVSSTTADTPTEKGVTFNETVSVVPIPMRSDYSHRVRERLWNDVDDILINAQRNAMEFAAEGWDWRTVVEDEYMYRDASTGELIHPVHMEES